MKEEKKETAKAEAAEAKDKIEKAGADESPETETLPASDLKELRDKLEAETRMAAEAQDKLVRTLAEWDNSRKRLAKEK